MANEPKSIGRYEIQGELGHGAMGVVYLAFDPLLKRPLAIKTVRERGGDNTATLLRFQREAEISARLNHPNIVTVHDVGQDPEMGPFLAMEYIEGFSLAHLIQDGLSAETTLQLLLQGMGALQAAERAGITHRDVKPENILVSLDGRFKLMDFGIARGEGARLTQAGQIFGTPSYTAPEVLIGGEPSPVSDRYAFAITAFQMLSGLLPFECTTVGATLFRIVHEPPKYPESMGPGLRAVFDKALAKDPTNRYPDLPSFMQDLIRALGLPEEIQAKFLAFASGEQGIGILPHTPIAESHKKGEELPAHSAPTPPQPFPAVPTFADSMPKTLEPPTEPEKTAQERTAFIPIKAILKEEPKPEPLVLPQATTTVFPAALPRVLPRDSASSSSFKTREMKLPEPEQVPPHGIKEPVAGTMDSQDAAPTYNVEDERTVKISAEQMKALRESGFSVPEAAGQEEVSAQEKAMSAQDEKGASVQGEAPSRPKPSRQNNLDTSIPDRHKEPQQNNLNCTGYFDEAPNLPDHSSDSAMRDLGVPREPSTGGVASASEVSGSAPESASGGEGQSPHLVVPPEENYQALVREEETPAQPEDVVPLQPPQKARKASRWPWIVGTVAILIGLLVAVFFWRAHTRPITLDITSSPTGAVVLLHDREIGRTNLLQAQIPHEGGSLRFELDGYEPQQVEVQRASGPVHVVLARSPYSIHVVTDPSGAEAFLNGMPVGTTPLQNLKIRGEGRQELVLRLKDYQQWSTVLSRDNPLPALIVLQPLVVTIRIRTTPAGAEAFLDGKKIGVTPLSKVDIKPSGEQQLVLKLKGYKDWSGPVSRERILQDPIFLVPMVGRLAVHTEPSGATVYLDGNKIGSTPIEDLPVPYLGTHHLRITLDGYREWTLTVDPSKPLPSPIQLVPIPKPPPPSPVTVPTTPAPVKPKAPEKKGFWKRVFGSEEKPAEKPKNSGKPAEKK